MCAFFKRNFRRPQLIPLLFIIASTITLTSLGAWQVERLAWKNALVKQIEQVQNLPPLQELLAELEHARQVGDDALARRCTAVA